jgi:hypothetical protein
VKQPRLLYHLMRADYLERVRRHAFLVTLGLTVYFAYLSMPPNHSRYITLQIGDYRGLYNSAWVGCLVALMTSAFLSLVGFYLVKNAIERDRRTGVGPILATTPLSRWQYTLGKWTSNLAVLATMLAIMAVCAIGMQLLRGEDRSVDLAAIVVPFALIALPAMVVTAGCAILFEATPGLRGGAGNVVYFFLWSLLFVAPDIESGARYRGIGSAVGVSSVIPGMIGAVSDEFGVAADSLGFNLGFSIKETGTYDLETFRWNGPTWSMDLLSGRLAWTIVGVSLALVASIPFDRFEKGTTLPPSTRRRKRSSVRGDGTEDGADEVDGTAITARVPTAITAIPAAGRNESLVPMVLAELRLAVRDMPRAWLIVAVGLAVACGLAPLAMARAWILPFAWIWPLPLWSGLGAREARHGTAGLVFSAPRALARQLPALWLAGVVVTVAMGAGVGLRLLATGDVLGLMAWTVGAVFVPSLALAAGIWTGGGKLFEVLYMLLWYAGPVNRTPFLDFMGTTEASTSSGTIAVFATATVVLVACAVVGRWRAVRG